MRLTDFRAFKMSFVRSSTFVRSIDIRALMSGLLSACQTFVRLECLLCVHRLSCVQLIFVCSCPDFRAFNRILCVHVRTSLRSPDSFAFSRFFLRLCQDTCLLTRLLCVYVQTLVRLPDSCAFMFKLSCVHVQNFKR